MIAQVVESLSPTWETWIEFPAPCFDLAQPLLLPAFGGMNQWMGDLCSSALQINKYKFKKEVILVQANFQLHA